MKRMEDAKKRYDEIPIPAELGVRVQQEIAKADARRAADTDSVTGQVNEDIYTFCETYAAEAQQRAEEYKEAFLATGGTQEEWERMTSAFRCPMTF